MRARAAHMPVAKLLHPRRYLKVTASALGIALQMQICGSSRRSARAAISNQDEGRLKLPNSPRKGR